MMSHVMSRPAGRCVLTVIALLGCSAVDLTVMSAPAEAQEGRSARQRRRPIADLQVPRTKSRRESGQRQASAAKITGAPPKSAAVLQPAEPLVAVISLPNQRIQVYGASGTVAESRVSTGTASHPTPTGVFSILQRNRYHESNIYSGAPMPFMQRLTWSGIALHQGVVPNHPASHGCIRLPGEFASQMWGLGRLGMRVIVAAGDAPTRVIAHARLPQPIMTPVDAALLPEAVKTAAVALTSSEKDQRLLDPFRLAHVRKAQAAAAKQAAEAAVKPAFERAVEASAEAARATESLRRAEAAIEVLRFDVAEKRAIMARSQTADADSPEGLSAAAAEKALDGAEQELAVIKATERAMSDAAFDAAKAARAAEVAVETTGAAIKTSNAGVEPVTIFVSHKEGRVFIRQGFVPLHDEPIAISEPERPLGTHVYTAIAASEDGGTLTWMAVTVPSNPPKAAAAGESRKKGKEQVQAPKPQPPHLPASSASDVLERFELPEATKKLVADRLWPGASLIVSDYGISGETGRGTDFIVLTK